jgi:hypothetical protein
MEQSKYMVRHVLLYYASDDQDISDILMDELQAQNIEVTTPRRQQGRTPSSDTQMLRTIDGAIIILSKIALRSTYLRMVTGKLLSQQNNAFIILPVFLSRSSQQNCWEELQPYQSVIWDEDYEQDTLNEILDRLDTAAISSARGQIQYDDDWGRGWDDDPVPRNSSKSWAHKWYTPIIAMFDNIRYWFIDKTRTRNQRIAFISISVLVIFLLGTGIVLGSNLSHQSIKGTVANNKVIKTPTIQATPTPTEIPTKVPLKPTATRIIRTTPTRLPTRPPSTPIAGANGVSASASVSASGSYTTEQLTISNSQTISELNVSVVVQKSSGVAFYRLYVNTSDSSKFTTTHTEDSTTITYTFTLKSGQTLSASSGRRLIAQFTSQNANQDTSHDTFTITSTSNDTASTISGHF